MAVPDTPNLGVRLQRFARCALDPDSTLEYLVRTAGVAADM